MDNFDPYNVFLANATNIPVLLMTGFVVQGHMMKETYHARHLLLHSKYFCVYPDVAQ